MKITPNVKLILPKVALKSMSNNKSPDNDGLSKQFYEAFWEDIKDVFINSLKKAK